MRKLAITILLSISCILALAQSTIKVQASNIVGLDEQFSIRFIVEGESKPSSFEWSAGEDFQLVWGPSKSSSTSVSIVNGKQSKSSEVSYTYVLMPKKVGKFTLNAAEAIINGTKYQSNVTEIEVIANSSSSTAGNAQNNQSNNQNSNSTSSEDIFLRLSFSKTKAIVGEPITATLKIYQRVNIAGFEDVKFPSFDGFWSQESLAPNNIEFRRENLNNQIYNAAVIRSWNLTPQRAGVLKIDPAEIVCLINQRTARTSPSSIFDSFFQDEYQTIRKRISSGAQTIQVDNLPAGAPSSFKGAVGTDFLISAELSRDSLKTHDAASLLLRITGKGNTALLEAPNISLPPDFELYDVKSSDIPGGKQFEYPFIPRSHGDFVIDPINYAYYDIKEAKYIKLQTKSLSIRVNRSTEASGQTDGQLYQAPKQKDVRDLSNDIRYIYNPMPKFSKSGDFFLGSKLFWGLLILILHIAGFAYVGLRRHSARKADVAGSRKRAASKMARKRLALAGSFLKKDLHSAFYEELHKAILGFVSDKLDMNAFEMSKDNILQGLCDKACSKELAEKFISLLDACEYARYSPDSDHEAMNSHYEKSINVICSIDESMKRKPSKNSQAGLSLLIILALTLPLKAQSKDFAESDSLWFSGVEAYAEGRWAEATNAWTELLDLGLESPELYYNLGNAFIKSEDISHAILNYERALRLDPSYADARYNLEYAQKLVLDKIETVPEFFLKTWNRSICWLLSSDSWSIIAIIFFVCTLGFIMVFVLSHRRGLRKLGFGAGLSCLILSSLCLYYAIWQRNAYFKQDQAIVTRAVSSVKSSPSGDKDLFILHEGTKVQILDRLGEWNNIELSDGRQGWIKSSDIEVI